MGQHGIRSRHATGMSMIVIAASFTSAAMTRAAEIEAESKISTVTVYPDGALVARTLEVDIPAGANTLTIRKLPATIDPNSIRIDGVADGGLTLTSVDVKPVAGDPNATADPERAARLDQLKTEQARNAGLIDAAEAQKAAIQRFAQTGPDKLGTNGHAMDVADWPKAWAAIGDGLKNANEALRDLKDKDTHLKAEIAALQKVNPSAPRGGMPTSEVRLAVDAGTARHATLTLRYQVRGASWTPLYDAALTMIRQQKPALTLSRRAKVVQQTGEDWTAVALTLSTVQLNRGTNAPIVLTNALTLAEPEVVLDALTRGRVEKSVAPRGQSYGGAQSPETAQKVAPAALPAPQPVREAQATIDAGPYQATFAIPGPVSVPQDGSEKSFTIGSRSIEPEVLVKTAPSLDTTAYIEAAFANDDEVPLLAGQVMIHRDGTFVGRSALPFVAPSDKATLGFGADDAVKVTRVAVKKRENDAGWTGTTRSDIQDYKTTLKNLHAFPVRVTMVDGLPVSENVAITIEPLPTNTPPTEKIVDDKRGVMSWTYELKPSEARDVRLGRRIRWPADRDIVLKDGGGRIRFGGNPTF